MMKEEESVKHFGGNIMTQHFDRLPFVRRTILSIIFILCFQLFVFAEDITLQWDANTESDLKGYKLYYGSYSGAPYDGDDIEQGSSPITIDIEMETFDPSNPEITITNLDLSGYHYFALTAYNTEGLESDYSNEIFIGPDGVVDSSEAFSLTVGTSEEEETGCFIKTSVCK